MVTSLLLCALASNLLAADAEPGTLLTYRGQIVAVKEEGADSKKTFELQWFVAGESRAWWSLAEIGRGGWAWPEQFGVVELDEKLRARSGVGPSLLYDREDGRVLVPIVLPWLVPPVELKADATWNDGGLAHLAEAQNNGAWRITATGRLGRKRAISLDAATPVIVSMHETVFMGQGHEHALTFELARRERLEVEPLAKLVAAFESLAALRGKLLPQRRMLEVDWKPEQLQQLRAELPATAKLATATLVERLVGLAELDLRFQGGRTNSLAALKEMYVGKEVGKFTLTDTDNDAVSEADLRGAVAIFHFWDYRDPPVEAPYGQVGYLDFLYRQRKAAGVKVFGVAVRSEYADEAKRRATVVNSRKFKEFMNLTYPVLMDSGTLLKQLGDPRVAGAKLPLFVVVGRDGKIVEYHVGQYETGREQGLKQLDGVVTRALEKRE